MRCSSHSLLLPRALAGSGTPGKHFYPFANNQLKKIFAGSPRKCTPLCWGATASCWCSAQENRAPQKEITSYDFQSTHPYRLPRSGCRPTLHPQGTPYTSFSVATKTSWKDQNGKWQSHTEWHRAVVWGEKFSVWASIALSNAVRQPCRG